MTKKDFNQKVSEMVNYVKTAEVENIGSQLKPFADKFSFDGVFAYCMWCEQNFERNLRSDYKRKTTFTSDFSIAEWFVPTTDGMKAIADTLKKALTNWRDSVEWFGEIIIVLNLKSWEHHARGNQNYSRMYATLYHETLSLFFDWFDEDNEQHDKAMEYYYDYVD